jgi:hypothetical protein
MVWVAGISVAIILLCMFPKQTGLLILVIVAAGGWLIYKVSEGNRIQNEARARRDAMLVVTAGASKAVCPDPKWPVWVSSRNTSTDRSVVSVGFSIHAFRNGYSAPVMTARSLTSDKIIPPGQAFTQCWGMPRGEVPPAGETYETLTYVVSKSDVSWR